ncbi:hypothetical protein P3W85_10055 [Cupriavidus basilensis]|uniref:Secreted protein n=1 Tax=Cupriavidus basilensis TaxID=68895 RepID=A0ABT6AKZ5_9BURK|nr:hypothetical protein [Cupriavidus basilensis]MDF3833287.1 hypothetical protein [Cupriavidus basilensis]
MLPSFFGLRHMACLLAASAMMPAGAQTQQDQPANNYPTTARVEYVGECMAKNGGAQAYLYKCACAIDQIAARLPYDDYVESSTFARYATLGGEGGAIFRDPEYGKNAARRYRGIQEEALHACGIAPATRAAR